MSPLAIGALFDPTTDDYAVVVIVERGPNERDMICDRIVNFPWYEDAISEARRIAKKACLRVWRRNV